jgi:nucleotide-binding universal stress UspA family protein
MSEPIILVPLDGTKQALAALPVAIALGEIEQASLHILHVGECEQAGKESRSRIAPETDLLAGLAINTRVGMPAGEILQVAGELKPQAIVLCKHSATEGKKMLGRTAMKVLHDAPCPVVLVPPERRYNSMAYSSCHGAARWDTLYERRIAICGGAGRTWRR